MSPDPPLSPTILAVDDAPDTLSLLSDILESAGMTTLVVRSGATALSLLGQIKPDLILMDAVMPKMDGFETCRRIKKMREFAHVPVIFMTGLSDTEHVVKGFESGGSDYVTKPIAADELLARIRVHLANSRLAQSARIALDISGTPLVAVDAEGQMLWITPEGSKLFDRAADDAHGCEPRWREALAPVLSRIVTKRLDRAVLHETARGTLFGSFAGEAGSGEYLIRIGDNDSASDDEILRKHFDLTGREAEVLLWIAQGKSNRDVASILACSPRTVNKHLEQIYQKLKVENRTAAAMAAVRVLSSTSA
jgi:DNA-binding NarL/FixJ family response regulator